MEPKVVKPIAGDWESALGKPAPRCDACETGFEPGTSFVNSLDLVEGRLVRHVLCDACDAQATPSPFAFWRSRVAIPDANRPRPLDLNFLIELFQRLHGDQVDPTNTEVRYIVALLLLRKKVLTQVRLEALEAGETIHEVLVTRFTREKEGPEFRTDVPELTAEKMESIRDDLGRIFNLEDQ
ncbi:MAG: hypothetical protein KDB53_02305 [Planctomycetes bacterium]|nr:hypothetical protein [Planctomycetota bacterium]